jgi:hypothetical protein
MVDLLFLEWDRARVIVAVKVNTLRHDGASVLSHRVMTLENASDGSQFTVAL